MKDRKEAARRNRQAFPATAKIFDEFRAAFGDSTRLVCAVEGGKQIGKAEDVEQMKECIREANDEKLALCTAGATAPS